MSAVQVLNVRLQRADHTVPWGFNLQGGKDFDCPLLIQKVNLHSLADKCSMRTGDYILRIGSVSVEHLTHNQARETVVRQGNNLEMTLLRGAPPRSEDYQARFDFPQHQLMTPENIDRAPVLSPQVGVQLSNNKALLTQSYNSPMGLYSSQNIADSLVNTMKHMNNNDRADNFTLDSGSSYNSAPLSPTTSGSTSPVSSVLAGSITDYSDNSNNSNTSRLDTVTLATRYLYQPEKSFNSAPRPFYLTKKAFSEEVRPVEIHTAKTIEIKPVVANDETTSSRGETAKQHVVDNPQSQRKVSVFLKSDDGVIDDKVASSSFNGSMRRGSAKISGVSGRLLLKMIENEMDNKPLTMKDVETEQLKLIQTTTTTQPAEFKYKSTKAAAFAASPAKSVDAVMTTTTTSDANNNQVTVVQPVIADFDRVQHSSAEKASSNVVNASPLKTSYRSQFLKQRASFDASSSSPSWNKGSPHNSPIKVGYKLADSPKSSMAQSRSFKLLEQTLNDGVAEKDAVFEKFVTEKSQYRRCSIQTQLSIEDSMSSLRVGGGNEENTENDHYERSSSLNYRKVSMPTILNVSERIEQLRKSGVNSNNKTQRSNSDAFVPTAFQRSWLIQKSKDMNAIEESDSNDVNISSSSDLLSQSEANFTNSQQSVVANTTQHPASILKNNPRPPASLNPNTGYGPAPTSSQFQNQYTQPVSPVQQRHHYQPPPPPPSVPTQHHQPHYNPYQQHQQPRSPPVGMSRNIGGNQRSGGGGGSGATRHARGSAFYNQAINPSTKMPACAMCSQVIRGPFISAVGREWCPNHFVCAQPSCGISLQDVGFVEENGKLYCEMDYERYFAPVCSKCQTKILGEVCYALDRTFHSECFVCGKCKQKIGSGTFHIEDGVPYCTRDFNALFATKCAGCEFPIEAGDKFLDAINQKWHVECFICSTCNVPLTNTGFATKGNKPYCKKHAY